MPGAPGDPGSALAPGGERPGGTAAPAAGAGPEAAPRAEGTASGGSAPTTAPTTAAASATAATSGAPEAGDAGEATAVRTNTPRGEAESTAEPTASPASSSAAAPTRTASASTSSASAAAAEPATAGGPVPGIAATATGTGGGGGASSQEGDEPPGSRPKKPMLAAAGIVGAILIAVPFLLAGQDDREPERTRTENAAGTVLDSERPPVPETYTSQSPVPSAKPSKKEEKKEKKEKPAGPVVQQQPVTPSPSPSPEKPKAEEKPKPKVKPKAQAQALTPAEQLRQWANGRSGVQNTVIKNASTGQCVDIGGYGKGQINNAVNQYPCNGTTGDNQLWNLDIVDQDGGPQNAPLFLIRNSKDGLCLDLGYYNARSEGTKVAQFHCNASGDNQLWWLDPRGDGTNWIRNAVSKDLCLRPTGGASAGNDARLEIAPCGYGDHWIV